LYTIALVRALTSNRCAFTPNALFSFSRFPSAVPGHEQKGGKKSQHDVAGISPPGATGVIYVTDRATANGFKPGGDGVRLPRLFARPERTLANLLPSLRTSVGQLRTLIPAREYQHLSHCRLTLRSTQGQGAPESKSILTPKIGSAQLTTPLAPHSRPLTRRCPASGQYLTLGIVCARGRRRQRVRADDGSQSAERGGGKVLQ
jgi:hypothetical protein